MRILAGLVYLSGLRLVGEDVYRRADAIFRASGRDHVPEPALARKRGYAWH